MIDPAADASNRASAARMEGTFGTPTWTPLDEAASLVRTLCEIAMPYLNVTNTHVFLENFEDTLTIARKLICIFLVFTAIAFGAMISMRYFFPTLIDLKYKLTVSLLHAGTPYTVDGVSHVVVRRKSCWYPNSPCVRWNVDAEALPLQLSSGERIFILQGAPGRQHISRLAVKPFLSYSRDGTIVPLDVTLGTKIALSATQFPAIVHFDNINDPQTAEWAHAGGDKPRGEEKLGSIQLISVTLETSEEATTHRLQDMLPWFESIKRTGMPPSYSRPDKFSAAPEFLKYFF